MVGPMGGPGDISVDRRGFARLLWKLAELIRSGEIGRSFRATAYRRAVWSLDWLDPGLDVSEVEALKVPGIGPGVARLLAEYRSTGRLSQLVPLEEAYPTDSARLRLLPRMTPAKLRDLHAELGVDTVEDLKGAIQSGAALTIRGLGERTLEWWSRVLALPPSDTAVPGHQGWSEATRLLGHLTEHTGVEGDVAGGLRRGEEWAEEIHLVVVTEDPDPVAKFVGDTAALADSKELGRWMHRGLSHSGVPVGIEVARADSAGTSLFTATGPSSHVDLVADGSSHPTELELYRSAGLEWVPPAARGLELERARGVVRSTQIAGDLHLHSEASPDGRMPVRSILEQAVARGFEYVLITDHTEGLRFGGLGGAGLMAQREILRYREEYPSLGIFHGGELNIAPDGSLDLDDDALAILDFAVAGVHSHFDLPREDQTARLLQAMRHPVVAIVAHPLGRRIGRRPAMDLNMDRIFEVAASLGVALETNGHRDRLDLPSEWLARASEHGALFAANSDAHRVAELDNIDNAVATLQRAGIGPERVVNTFPLERFSEWATGHARRNLSTHRPRLMS